MVSQCYLLWLSSYPVSQFTSSFTFQNVYFVFPKFQQIMELMRWRSVIKEFLPPCCYKFAADICTCVKAVDAELKPSYMFDVAFVPSHRIIAWLKRLHDVHLVHCRLSVIAIEQQIFIVNRSAIKHRMDKITCGNERVMMVDVSSDLQQPQSTPTVLYQTIVQYTAQVVETAAADEYIVC